MALAARRGTFGGDRGDCGGRLDLALLALADERAAAARPTAKQAAEVSRIRELEDQDAQIQNKMASLVILKSGPMRWLVTRIVLGLFNLIYRTLFTDVTPGRLAGLHTIHFGHWTVSISRPKAARSRRP